MNVRDAESDLREAVELYKNTVYGTAYANLDNNSDADDVFQETFLLYYKKDLEFENETARRTWLIKTALNLCKKANMNSWRMRVDRLDDLDEGAAGTVELLTDEESEVISAVRELDEKLRVPVYLFYFEGMRIEEIASILKINSGAAQVRLVRARKKLKEKLKGEYFYE